MSDLKTAQQHNLEHGVSPYQNNQRPVRAERSELVPLSLSELVTRLLDDGYFEGDPELAELLREKV